MRVRLFCLALALLVSLGAGGAASAQGPFRPGTVELDLSANAISSLPLDPSLWAEGLCDPTVEPPARMAKCHIVVRTVKEPPPPGRAMKIGVTVPEGRGTPHASVRDLALAVYEDIQTSCGPWNATVILDPAREQPSVPLALQEVPLDPGRGVFAGALEMRTILRLTHSGTGRTADFPLRARLHLTGLWVLDPSVGTPASSDLVLLADRIDGEVVPVDHCIPGELFTFPDVEKDLLADDCQVCLVGHPPAEGEESP